MKTHLYVLYALMIISIFLWFYNAFRQKYFICDSIESTFIEREMLYNYLKKEWLNVSDFETLKKNPLTTNKNYHDFCH